MYDTKYDTIMHPEIMAVDRVHRQTLFHFSIKKKEEAEAPSFHFTYFSPSIIRHTQPDGVRPHVEIDRWTISLSVKTVPLG